MSALTLALVLIAPAAAQAASITAVPPGDAVEGITAEVRARGEGGTAGSRISFYAVPAPADEPCPEPQNYTGSELSGSGAMTGAGAFDVGGATSFRSAGRYRLCAFVNATTDRASPIIASDTTKLFTVRRPRGAIGFTAPASPFAGQASTVNVTATSEGVSRALVAVVRETDRCSATLEGFLGPAVLARAEDFIGSGSVTFALRVPGLAAGRYLVCGIVISGDPGATPEASAALLVEIRPAPFRPAPCVVPTNLRRVGAPVALPKSVESGLRNRLAKAGCSLGTVTLREDKSSRPQDVLNLSARGTQPPGTRIDVVVSLGWLCRVPNVLGRSLAVARRRFATSGCNLRYVQRVRRRGVRAGRVVEIRRVKGKVIRPSRRAKPLPNGTKIRILVTR